MSIRDLLTIGCVFNPIDLADEAMREWFGVPHPRIAVCGLNPHAGEEGLFGSEEIEEIIPAVEEARKSGLRISGPYPPDVVFRLALGQEDKIAIALYHDQGLIAFKLEAFDQGVNLSLGLPFVRTSPDHGTAFDIAGKNAASAESLIEAIKLAVELSSP
jgi:4-hydroxythreonine-4-phosphate dehydrogenase